MGATYNHVTLLGNLTRDPELKYLQSGTAVCEFSLAISEKYTSNGKTVEEVSYLDCTAFGRVGEVINQYLTKGDPVLIDGRLKQERWDDKNGGGKRSKVKVIVNRMQMIGGKKDGGGGGSRRSGGTGSSSGAPPEEDYEGGAGEGGGGTAAGTRVPDEDIPF